MLIMHLFVSYAHVNLCDFFSSPWCRGLAAASACGFSLTFLFTIFASLLLQYQTSSLHDLYLIFDFSRMSFYTNIPCNIISEFKLLHQTEARVEPIKPIKS